MLSKFTVNLLKTAPKATISAFYSTGKAPSQLKKEKPPKDYTILPSGPCDTDKVICFVEKHFMKEEPLYKSVIPGKKPKLIRDMLRNSIDQGLSVIAKNSCDNSIVGVCVNELSCKLDGVKVCKLSHDEKDCNIKKLLEVWAIVALQPKIFETLGQDRLFHVAVLSVDEKHYGKGIGLELVRESLKVGKQRGYEFAKMNGTSDTTRIIAEKLGFQKFWSKPYKEILKVGGTEPIAYPPHPHTDISVFYKNLKCPS